MQPRKIHYRTNLCHVARNRRWHSSTISSTTNIAQVTCAHCLKGSRATA